MEATEMTKKTKGAKEAAVKEAAVKEAAGAVEEAATEAAATLNLSTEDLQILARYRSAGEDCLREIGQIEIRKARLIGSYGQLEQASQTKLQEVGKTLGIDEGVAWSVQPDGSVVLHEGTMTEGG
jgi:hypothetical protein